MYNKFYIVKDIMEGKLFQRCTHLLYCSVLSLGANVNKESIFHIKNQWNTLVIGNYYVNYQNYQNLMLLTSSDTSILVYKFRPERTGLIQYVLRVYATAINFPCITLLYIVHYDIHCKLRANDITWFLKALYFQRAK